MQSDGQGNMGFKRGNAGRLVNFVSVGASSRYLPPQGQPQGGPGVTAGNVSVQGAIGVDASGDVEQRANHMM